MKGYVKASRYYFDNVLVQKDGRLAPGPHYDEVLAITAKYTGASPAVVRVGFPYQDRNGRLGSRTSRSRWCGGRSTGSRRA
jgi:NitT/TauT family transport system substrate-binding protein